MKRRDMKIIKYIRRKKIRWGNKGEGGKKRERQIESKGEIGIRKLHKMQFFYVEKYNAKYM